MARMKELPLPIRVTVSASFITPLGRRSRNERRFFARVLEGCCAPVPDVAATSGRCRDRKNARPDSTDETMRKSDVKAAARASEARDDGAMDEDFIARLRAQLGGPRDGALLRFSLGNALLCHGDAIGAATAFREAVDRKSVV